MYTSQLRDLTPPLTVSITMRILVQLIRVSHYLINSLILCPMLYHADTRPLNRTNSHTLRTFICAMLNDTYWNGSWVHIGALVALPPNQMWWMMCGRVNQITPLSTLVRTLSARHRLNSVLQLTCCLQSSPPVSRLKWYKLMIYALALLCIYIMIGALFMLGMSMNRI